jgi:hypothetical protein
MKGSDVYIGAVGLHDGPMKAFPAERREQPQRLIQVDLDRGGRSRPSLVKHLVHLIGLLPGRHVEYWPVGQQRSVHEVPGGLAQELHARRAERPGAGCPEVLQQQRRRAPGGVVRQGGLHLEEHHVGIRTRLEEVMGGAHPGDATTDDSDPRQHPRMVTHQHRSRRPRRCPSGVRIGAAPTGPGRIMAATW